jgi:DNA-binding transcriptional LysR family regulator
MESHILPDVTLHQLRIFSAVVREGGFARAAEAMYLSEPTVSDQVRLLERLVGTRLLERAPGRRKVVLTEAGSVMLQAGHEALQALERGVSAVSALRGSAGGTVVVGTGADFGDYVLPRLYERFRRIQPGITVRIEVDDHRRVIESLKRRRVDLAVLVGPFSDPDVAVEPLSEFDMLLVGPVGHRFAAATPVSFRDMLAEPLILPSGSARATLERLALGTSLRVVLEANSADARLQAVKAGLGIAAVTTYSAQPYLNAGELCVLNVSEFPIPLLWSVVFLEEHLSDAARSFKAHLLLHRESI